MLWYASVLMIELIVRIGKISTIPLFIHRFVCLCQFSRFSRRMNVYYWVRDFVLYLSLVSNKISRMSFIKRKWFYLHNGRTVNHITTLFLRWLFIFNGSVFRNHIQTMCRKSQGGARLISFSNLLPCTMHHRHNNG